MAFRLPSWLWTAASNGSPATSSKDRVSITATPTGHTENSFPSLSRSPSKASSAPPVRANSARLEFGGVAPQYEDSHSSDEILEDGMELVARPHKDATRKLAGSKKRIHKAPGIDDSDTEDTPAKRSKSCIISPTRRLPTPESNDPNPETQDEENDLLGITRSEKNDIGAVSNIERGEVASRDDPKFSEWTDTEIEMFNLVNGLGLDPLLPRSWELDFPTLPQAMFAPDCERPSIYSVGHNDLLAIRQLQRLISSGARVRERLSQRLHCSHILRNGYNKYLQWAMTDAGLDQLDLLPTVIVKANRRNEDYESLIERVQTEMARLSEQHRSRFNAALTATAGSQDSTSAAIAPLPVLFGLMIYRSSVVVVALNTADEDSEPVARANFEYGQLGMDVWHGIGVAIVIMLARKHQMSVQAPRIEAQETDDPDI